MPRRIYIADHEFPPTEADLAAALAANCPEVVCGIPPALAALGIETFGAHELPDPAPVVPQLIEMGKAKLQMLDTPWPMDAPTTTLWAEVKALADSDEALAIELTRPYLSRTRDKTLELQAYFGLSDAVVDALFIAADARP